MRKSDRIYAFIAALLIHLLLLVAMSVTFLTYPPDDVEEWPPQPPHEIVLDEIEPLYASGEFVRTGDNLDEVVPENGKAPSSVSEPVPTQDAADTENAGAAAQPKRMVASEKESSAKEDKKTGPAENALEKKRQEAKRQQQAKKNAADATRKAFGGGDGKSSAGSVEGRGDTGAITGRPGNGLQGRTMESWTTVGSTKLGVIAIRVRVNAQGQVVSATYDATASSGPVAADAAMRQSCISRSRQCRFSVLKGSPVQSGTITWVFK